jgi:nucleoside triphosphate diphosphatase
MSESSYTWEDLRYLMARLRDPETGCPWDLQQTADSIAPHTLEEVYELVATIESGDIDAMRDELGDVLFQVVFYAQLAQEQAHFDLSDVVHGLVSKLIRRHPHIFSDGNLRAVQKHEFAAEAVIDQWESIKQAERETKLQMHVLDDVPVSLPALTRAQKLQKRASTVGLDWVALGPVLSSLKQELGEFEAALAHPEKHDDIAHELGDLMFCCVNLARHLKLDAEQVQRAANQRFEARVRAFTALAEQQGLTPLALTDEQRDALWSAAKQQVQMQSEHSRGHSCYKH